VNEPGGPGEAVAAAALPGLHLGAADYVVVVVGDLDASVAFYTETLGIPLAHRSGPFAQLDTGTTRIGLFEREVMAETIGRPIEGPPDPTRPAFELGFHVDSVDTALDIVAARGVTVVVPATDRAWGQRTAYIADPDGNLIELVETLYV